MTSPTTLPGPQPIATDSSNSRLHRQQIAAATNALIKKVFDNNTSTTQQIASLTQTVTNNNTTLTASLSSEAGIRASADSALGSSITSINAALNGYTGANAVANAVSSLNASISTTNGNVSALSSSVTTLSTTVGGNSASITSLTSSVNGINTMWGLELDSNGNIIGRVEMSGSGATSTFSVHANNFEVYNGSSSTPAFAISGGVAQLNVPLQTNAVGNTNIQSTSIDTSKVINNAVTSASVGSGSSIPITTPFGGAYTTLASVTASLTGTGNVLLSFTDYITWSSNGPRGFYQIIDSNGNTWLRQGYGGGSCPDFIATAGTAVDTSGQSGSVTYYLQADWEAGNMPTSMIPSLTVSQLKK